MAKVFTYLEWQEGVNKKKSYTGAQEEYFSEGAKSVFLIFSGVKYDFSQ